jgi:serine/threonine protein kinase
VTPERWQQIKALFQTAVELAPADRATFLNRVCGEGDSLRREVESLLAQHERAGSFISSPPHEIMAEMIVDEPGATVGQSIKQYKIVSLLGKGGMGEVYLAHDTKLNRKVALKLLPVSLSKDEERLRRFKQEARAASALNHPNVCVIHEIGETDDGRHFIAMEYIDGVTLRHRLVEGSLKLSEAIEITIQTASALTAAHEAGVVHRDIKPENIMLRCDGYAKVLDFGLAKLTERYALTSDSEALTFPLLKSHSGLLLGTTNYLSPEQARRERVDERADIWSLGVVLYEMLTGCLAFTGETPSHVIVAILESEPPPLNSYLAEAPAELEWIVKKALRKDREQRYQTAKELLSDLRDIERRMEVEFADARARKMADRPPVSRARHSSAFKSISETLSRPRLSLAVFLIAMALVGLIVWIMFQYLRNRSAPLFQTLEVTKLTNSGNVADATISPDGKYVVYVVDELSKQSLWARHVATGSSVMIAAPDDVHYEGLSFSKDSNYVYYVRQEKDQIGILYEVPVVGGATRQLVRNVDSAVTLSPDGQRFAFVRVGLSTSKLIISKADGLGEQELVSGEKTEGFTSPSWSPDSTMIAYAVGTFSDGYHMTLVANPVEGGEQKVISPRRWYSIRRVTWLGDNTGLIIDASEQPYGVFQLWYVTYPGGSVERITNDLDNYRSLALTANSDALVTVKSDKSTNIWLFPLRDPSRARKLISEVGNYFGVSWFPDGRIAFSSMASGNPDIWVINSDSTGQKQLTSNNGANYHPSVSPDGRYIAFTCYRGGVFTIWRMDADGSNQKQLTTGDGAFHPSWSPDGRWVFYEVLASGSATLWKVGADGGDAVVVTKYYSSGPAVSPDGRLISCTYFDDQVASLRYAALPSEGGSPIKLFGSPDPNRQRVTRWTPDSQALLYVDTHDGGSNIWSQALKEAVPRQVTNYESDQIFDFDLSPDGRQLILTRGATVSDVVLIRGLRRSS